jgi:hypothetical protein
MNHYELLDLLDKSGVLSYRAADARFRKLSKLVKDYEFDEKRESLFDIELVALDYLHKNGAYFELDNDLKNLCKSFREPKARFIDSEICTVVLYTLCKPSLDIRGDEEILKAVIADSNQFDQISALLLAGLACMQEGLSVEWIKWPFLAAQKNIVKGLKPCYFLDYNGVGLIKKINKKNNSENKYWEYDEKTKILSHRNTGTIYKLNQYKYESNDVNDVGFWLVIQNVGRWIPENNVEYLN